MNQKAVVLLSGGLDSATVLAIVKSRGYTPYALSFRYGQRHEAELQAAKILSSRLGVADHVVAEPEVTFLFEHFPRVILITPVQFVDDVGTSNSIRIHSVSPVCKAGCVIAVFVGREFEKK